MLYLVVFSVVLVLGVALFMRQPQFGRAPAGIRLRRVQNSPNYRDGAFQNLNPTPQLAEGVSPLDILRSYIKPAKNRQPDRPLPSVRTNLEALPSGVSTLVWFGHSSYLVRMAGKTILVDPVFSGSASPVSFFGKNYGGSNVYSVADLPEIDALLITHDHYDHLDYDTITRLRSKVKQVVTSLGVGAHLEKWGYASEQIHELDWHETVGVAAVLTFTALPARHFSGRGFRRNQTLWSSFVLQSADHKLYLGGDSGYDSHFKAIGNQYGPFDLAVLECGQFNEYWKYIHMMPEQTAQAAVDLRAKVLMPVHWAKFTLALHAWHEPAERVSHEAEKMSLPVTTPMIGQPVVVGKEYPTATWWR
jgi:L-ascorbate metabolism protein UlaG (beta-lactamase superfamily)